jgi:hypothetical protein
MRFSKLLLSFSGLIVLASVSAGVLATDLPLGSMHGTQCNPINPNDDVRNTVWGIENRNTSNAKKVSCALQITGDLRNSNESFKVVVTMQDWRGENECRALIRNENGTSVYTTNWERNFNTGSYADFTLINRPLGFTDVGSKFLVLECELHKKLSNSDPATIRAINVYRVM